jgi:hypothetical protein
LQLRREWDEEREEKKICQTSILDSEKLSFRNKGEIKSFSDKQKLQILPCKNSLIRICLQEIWHREAEAQ